MPEFIKNEQAAQYESIGSSQKKHAPEHRRQSICFCFFPCIYIEFLFQMAAWRIQQNFDALVRLHALSTGTSNARHPIHPRVPHRLFGFSAMTISWEILISQNALHLGQRWEMRVAIQFYKISHDVQVLAPQLAHWFCMKLARGATLKPSAWSGMEWRWRPCNSCTINHLKSQVKYFLSSLHFFVWIILNRFLEKQFFRRFARASL